MGADNDTVEDKKPKVGSGDSSENEKILRSGQQSSEFIQQDQEGE